MPALNDVLRQLKLDRVLFTLAYLRGRAPWDTGVAPPELVAAVEGPQALAPGRALDLGCGTGTTALYLARLGWRVTGVDFAAPAIRRAQAKARQLDGPASSARFLRGDATNLDALHLGEAYTLLFDQGCLHGIPREKQRAYAAGLARHAAPGALFLLYAFGPRQIGARTIGLAPDEVRALFAPAFAVERVVQGTDTGRGFSSAWYWLRRAVR
jgi:SAM-dependent methyltransferase